VSKKGKSIKRANDKRKLLLHKIASFKASIVDRPQRIQTFEGVHRIFLRG
jgi:hypothetical protein